MSAVAGRSAVGRVLPWVAVVLGVALVVAVAGRPGEEGNPLDPASPGPLGTKGLVEVLRELGGQVRVSADRPGAGTETALLLSDDLTPERRQEVLGWVRQGGTLVVADPSSAVTEVKPVGSTRIGLLDAELERRCAEAALADVRRVAAPGGVVFEVPEAGRGPRLLPPERRRLAADPAARQRHRCPPRRGKRAGQPGAGQGRQRRAAGQPARPGRGDQLSRCSSRPCPAGATPGWAT